MNSAEALPNFTYDGPAEARSVATSTLDPYLEVQRYAWKHAGPDLGWDSYNAASDHYLCDLTTSSINSFLESSIRRWLIPSESERELREALSRESESKVYDGIVKWLEEFDSNSSVLIRHLSSEDSPHRNVVVGALIDKEIEISIALADGLVGLLGSDDQKLSRLAALALSQSQSDDVAARFQEWLAAQPKSVAERYSDFLEFALG